MIADYKLNPDANPYDKIKESDTDQNILFTLFLDLSHYFNDNDQDNCLDVLLEISDEIFDQTLLPQGFSDFLIENQFYPILHTLIENPLNDEIFFNIINILDQIVSLSVKDHLVIHDYLYQNGLLGLLFKIRELIPPVLIPAYIHLIANFSFCDISTRNEILIQFSPLFFHSLITVQGQRDIKIRQKSSFLIWRMTMYSLLDDESFSDFISWVIDFFAEHQLSFDNITLRYWLFALDNIINYHHEVSAPMLVAYGYSEIFEDFIKNRKTAFVELDENDENEELDDAKLENINQEKAEIDELLEIVLKVVLFLIEEDRNNVPMSIITEFFDIAFENSKICSCLSIKIIKKMIQKNANALLFDDLENVGKLIELFESASYSVKHEISYLLHEIIDVSIINKQLKIGEIALPILIESMNQTSDIEIIKLVLFLYDNLLWIGQISNGKYQNYFTGIFEENDGFDYLLNYKERLSDIGVDENGIYYFSDLFEAVLDYFPFLREGEEEEEEEAHEEYFDSFIS